MTRKKTAKKRAKKKASKKKAVPACPVCAERAAKTNPLMVYTKELADEIIGRMSEGESLKGICRDLRAKGTKIAESTVRRWAEKDRDGFFMRYERAQRLRMDSLSDEILEIADDARNDWMERHAKDDTGWRVNGEHIQRSRLRITTRQGLMGKLFPERFGDKIEVKAIKALADATDDELATAVKRQLEGAGEDGVIVLEKILLGLGLPGLPPTTPATDDDD